MSATDRAQDATLRGLTIAVARDGPISDDLVIAVANNGPNLLSSLVDDFRYL